MPDLLTLPLWSYGYIFLLCAMIVGGFVVDKNLEAPIVVGHIFSLVVSIVCVLAYCQIEFAKQLGIFLLGAMIAFGMSWDFINSSKDADRAETEMKKEVDITDTERSIIMTAGLFFGALLILPAYMMGLMACYNLVTLDAGG